ncbi:MAG: CDP-glucose 4,6-dehydratase [Caldisphaera sp.]
MTHSFYRNKRVLITGHTGFVGSWLTLWLHEQGANIIGYSFKPPSKPYLYQYLKFRDKITNIKGDIRKADTISNVIKTYKPEVIFHLAAQPILLKSYDAPVDTYLTNTVGTLNLLEACKKSQDSIKAVVIVTTDKVYENLGYKHQYKEGDKLGGFDPYSSSKACAEIIAKSYKNSFLQGMGIATVRAGNIIGGGDWGEYRIITDLIKSYTTGATLKLRHPDAVRPWTYILDTVNGYILLGENLYKNPIRFSGPWNFSAAYEKTVMDLVEEFSKYLNVRYTTVKSAKKHEDKLLLLNSSKVRSLLNWKPIINFEKSIRYTAEWYIDFYKNKGSDIYTYSKKQILAFQKVSE